MSTSTVTRIGARPAEALIRVMKLLTESKTVLVPRDGGIVRRVEQPSLLVQLGMIVNGGPGASRGGGASGANRKAPMYLPAYELITEIRVKSLAGSRRLATFPVNITAPVGDAVNQYARLSLLAGEEATVEALDLLSLWARTIPSLIDPPVVKELLVACPECEATDVQLKAEDSSVRKGPALVLTVRDEGGSFVSCRACLAVWTPEQTDAMARFINPDYSPYNPEDEAA